jgi:hypothetical protein
MERVIACTEFTGSTCKEMCTLAVFVTALMWITGSQVNVAWAVTIAALAGGGVIMGAVAVIGLAIVLIDMISRYLTRIIEGRIL